MGWTALAGSAGILMLSAAVALAQDGTPPLSGPITRPGADPGAPGELSQGFDAQPLPSEGAVLAVPGFALPGGGPTHSNQAAAAGTGFASDAPPLVGPASEGFGAPMNSQPWRPAPGSFVRGSRPMSMTPDTVTEGALSLPPERAAPGARLERPTIPNSEADAPASPSRRFRLFSRFQPPQPFWRPRDASRPDESSISVEPRSDPAADAALMRHIEHQVRVAAGNKLRNVDVRVVDRNITIRARVTRFWFRRNVKHTIESLPSLSGYHATVEVSD